MVNIKGEIAIRLNKLWCDGDIKVTDFNYILDRVKKLEEKIK